MSKIILTTILVIIVYVLTQTPVTPVITENIIPNIPYIHETPQVEEEEKIQHIETPEKVKSLYITAHATTDHKKMQHIFDLADQSEVNSVTIDIKTVSGYTTFDIDSEHFWSIKTASNGIISNPEALVKRFHDAGIYVVWRVVVFKDKRLAELRPDLAVQTPDTKKPWSDYKWLKYLDPGAKEVWDYNAAIAKHAYDIWFDEINFDYVRFPTDGNIRYTYYPHSEEIQNKQGKWGKIKVLDMFSEYITRTIKETHPDIKLSADIFWLITRHNEYLIWQNLESFLLYFDYIGPMIYPSHYGKWFLNLQVPDNHPYEIFSDATKFTINRIDKLNKQIEEVQSSTGSTVFTIQNVLDTARDGTQLEKVEYSKYRPWLQGFSCTRCRGATPYMRTKFREQIRALEEQWIHSWRVWNAASNYYEEWYDPDELPLDQIISTEETNTQTWAIED